MKVSYGFFVDKKSLYSFEFLSHFIISYLQQSSQLTKTFFHNVFLKLTGYWNKAACSILDYIHVHICFFFVKSAYNLVSVEQDCSCADALKVYELHRLNISPANTWKPNP